MKNRQEHPITPLMSKLRELQKEIEVSPQVYAVLRDLIAEAYTRGYDQATDTMTRIFNKEMFKDI